jgi:small subunit ribosomal protein S4
VNIPSYQLKTDDVVSLRERSSARAVVADATDLTASVSPWLQADHDNLTGKVLRLPDREDIDTPVQEQLIVELYSK